MDENRKTKLQDYNIYRNKGVSMPSVGYGRLSDPTEWITASTSTANRWEVHPSDSLRGYTASTIDFGGLFDEPTIAKLDPSMDAERSVAMEKEKCRKTVDDFKEELENLKFHMDELYKEINDLKLLIPKNTQPLTKRMKCGIIQEIKTEGEKNG